VLVTFSASNGTSCIIIKEKMDSDPIVTADPYTCARKYAADGDVDV
jgi:hypothetical protein